MKKIVFVILAFVLVTGTLNCQQQKKVKLIPNSEKEYTFIRNKYWEPNRPDALSFSYEQAKSMSNAVEKVKQKLKDGGSFKYALFINEKGKIDKIKPIESSSPVIDKLLADEMSNWEMPQHFENGKPHKYRIDWVFSIESSKNVNKKGISLISSNFPLIEKHFGEEFFVMVDKMPAPVGGINGIQEKVHYPELAKKAGIQGRVFIKAFINEKGNVAAAQVIKGIGSGCDESAINAVKKTKFSPASLKGKLVGAQVAIPIYFKLNNRNKANQIKN